MIAKGLNLREIGGRSNESMVGFNKSHTSVQVQDEMNSSRIVAHSRA